MRPPDKMDYWTRMLIAEKKAAEREKVQKTYGDTRIVRPLSSAQLPPRRLASKTGRR